MFNMTFVHAPHTPAVKHSYVDVALIQRSVTHEATSTKVGLPTALVPVSLIFCLDVSPKASFPGPPWQSSSKMIHEKLDLARPDSAARLQERLGSSPGVGPTAASSRRVGKVMVLRRLCSSQPGPPSTGHCSTHSTNSDTSCPSTAFFLRSAGPCCP